MAVGVQHMSKSVWIRHLSLHTHVLSRLASLRQGMAWLAWHGMVWWGVLVAYHLYLILEAMYPQK